jgi:hypothetical protein
MIHIGLGVKRARFWHSERGPGLDFPKAEARKDLFYDVLVLDERNDPHRSLALRAAERVHFKSLTFFAPWDLENKQPRLIIDFANTYLESLWMA